MKFRVALTQLMTFLNFYQEVFKVNLKSEEKFDQMLKMINPVQFMECASNSLRSIMIAKGDILALRSGQKTFSSSILGLSPHWDYKRHNENLGEKIIDLSKVEKFF